MSEHETLRLNAIETLDESSINEGFDSKASRVRLIHRGPTPEWLKVMWAEANIVTDSQNWKLTVLRLSEVSVAGGLWTNRRANFLARRRNS